MNCLLAAVALTFLVGGLSAQQCGDAGIAAKVTTYDGRPVAGAEITVWDTKTNLLVESKKSISRMPETSLVTDGAGINDGARYPFGKYEVKVETEGFPAIEKTVFLGNCRNYLVVRLSKKKGESTLSNAEIIDVYVSDENGKFVEGAKVRLLFPTSRLPMLPVSDQDRADAITNQFGRAPGWDGLPEGKAILLVTADGFDSFEQEITLTSERTTPRVVLKRKADASKDN